MKKILIGVTAVLAALTASFAIYVSIYYRADSSVDAYLTQAAEVSAEAESAQAAKSPDTRVKVEETAYGWFLDGPSEDNALIFYPGAKVDEKAYIPILHGFAGEGMDVCLVKMPFHLAFFGIDEASEVMEQYDYPNWYIGGHSLGGAMSAAYAADHADRLNGVVLLAAYATGKLDDSLVEVVVYGGQDGVLNVGKIEEGREFAPQEYFEKVIEGGNHAQFGNYGAQKGDGEAVISAQEQQEETIRFVMDVIKDREGNR